LPLSINTDKIFAAGHSLGGAASFIVCGKDKRIARGVNLDGAFYDAIDTDYTGKKLLLIYSDRDRYRPKNKADRLQFDTIVDGDKLRIEKLSAKANLQKLTFDLANHLNFSDISLIIQPSFAKVIGLIGKTDGLQLLLKTSTAIIDFFNK
jgi:dienelactone hydrolase